MNDDKSKVEVLRKIVGARLTSVQFVLDYLILGFDERGAVTTLVWPQVCTDEKCREFGIPGYRDALCELIGATVSELQITDDEVVLIKFSNARSLKIILKASNLPGERMIFTSPKHELVVW